MCACACVRACVRAVTDVTVLTGEAFILYQIFFRFQVRFSDCFFIIFTVSLPTMFGFALKQSVVLIFRLSAI